MKQKLSSYKENWLLKWGAISFLLLLVLVIFHYFFSFEPSIVFGSERGVKVIRFALMGALIAPVIEEIGFRGIFLKNKLWVFLGFIIMGGYVLILANIIFTIFYFIYIVLFLIWCSGHQENLSFKRSIYFINALLFTVAHITKDYSLFSLGIALQITSGFAVTFFCVWMVINFNLASAIIFHIFWNSLTLSTHLLGLQYPDTTIYTIENHAVRIEWQKNKIYPFKRNYKILNDSTRVYNNYILKDLIINHDDKYEQRDLNRPYNLTITLKDSLLFRDIHAYSDEVYQLLIEENLLILKSN